jgi:hypothetical protein
MNTEDYNYYKNSGFRNTRNRKRILILDVDDNSSSDNHLGSGGEFNIPLFEPLIIDKQSEVYLDNFISFNSNISNIPENSAFVLKINEFNINSNAASSTNNNEIFNSIIIPNEHNSVSNNHGVVLHKAKKFNYVCDINPGKIGRISGTITNLAGDPIFHSSETSNHFTYALTGIESGNLNSTAFPIINNLEFTDITNMTTTDSALVGGRFLANHLSTSTTLHFSTDKEITITNLGLDIVFALAGTDLTVTNGSTTVNPNLLLISNPGRFVAEFSINSRE